MIKEINLTPTSSSLEVVRANGSVIPGRCWGSDIDCKAVALLVHGLGAHSGWFEAFARQLKIRRVFAASYDQIGFGRQTGRAFQSYTQWIDDLVRVFDHLRKTFPNKPIYLIGNSMGALLSLVSLDYILPDGLVLLSPGFDGSPETFTLGYRLRAVVRALLSPDKDVELPYGTELCTRDQGARAWIDSDPDRRFSVPGRYLVELLKLSNSVKGKERQIKTPVLMVTAGHDKIVNNVVNERFFNRLTAPSKKSKHFADAWHDLMFDPQVDEVADEVVHWMSEHVVERLISG